MSLVHARRHHPKVPKDGFGPRGIPEIYYTSRVLKSTFHYVNFVEHLRKEEEIARIRQERESIESKEHLRIDFFTRTTRRKVIATASRRVEHCFRAYEEYLNERRQKLIVMLNAEEEKDIHLMTESIQKGAELAWNVKMDRLKYLLAKRQKELDDEFTDTPLSKSSHVLPCIYKMRSKEVEEIQLYQMREKQMRKLAEKEMDKMWHEVVLKQSEALTAREEYETMDRFRKEQKAKHSCLELLEQRRIQRLKEQERLKQETLRMRAKFNEDDKSEEEEHQRKVKECQAINDLNLMMAENHKKLLAQKQAAAKLFCTSHSARELSEEKVKEQRRRQKAMDTDECNRKMIEMKNDLEEFKCSGDPLILEEGQRRRDAVDLVRCQDRVARIKLNKEYGLAAKKEIKERQESMKKQFEETGAYYKQVLNQIDQLVKYNEMTDAQAQKLYRDDLRTQIEYREKQQERARQEIMQEEKKCQIARDQYNEEIKKMLSRPTFGSHVHPFMRKML